MEKTFLLIFQDAFEKLVPNCNDRHCYIIFPRWRPSCDTRRVIITNNFQPPAHPCLCNHHRDQTTHPHPRYLHDARTTTRHSLSLSSLARLDGLRRISVISVSSESESVCELSDWARAVHSRRVISPSRTSRSPASRSRSLTSTAWLRARTIWCETGVDYKNVIKSSILWWTVHQTMSCDRGLWKRWVDTIIFLIPYDTGYWRGESSLYKPKLLIIFGEK